MGSREDLSRLSDEDSAANDATILDVVILFAPIELPCATQVIFATKRGVNLQEDLHVPGHDLVVEVIFAHLVRLVNARAVDNGHHCKNSNNDHSDDETNDPAPIGGHHGLGGPESNGIRLGSLAGHLLVASRRSCTAAVVVDASGRAEFGHFSSSTVWMTNALRNRGVGSHVMNHAEVSS